MQLGHAITSFIVQAANVRNLANTNQAMRFVNGRRVPVPDQQVCQGDTLIVAGQGVALGIEYFIARRQPYHLVVPAAFVALDAGDMKRKLAAHHIKVIPTWRKVWLLHTTWLAAEIADPSPIFDARGFPYWEVRSKDGADHLAYGWQLARRNGRARPGPIDFTFTYP